MASLSLVCRRRQAVLLVGMVLLTALTLAPQALASPTVVNGSFEAEPFSSSGTLDLGGTNPLTGWTTLHNGTYPWGLPNSNTYNAGPTPYGNQWVIVGNFGQGGTYIQQAIDGFSVGKQYTLSFALASENVGERAPLQVSFPSGSSTASQTFLAPARGANYWDTWQTFTMSFVATSSNVTIRLAGLAGGDAGIDNVFILHPTSTVVGCSPNPVRVSKTTTCKVTVTDTNSAAETTPAGSVSVSASGKGTLSSASCTLTAVSTGVARCSVGYQPSSVGSGKRTISASYPGDSEHSASNGRTVLKVEARVLHLSVTPRISVAGNRTCYRFRTTSGGTAVAGAAVTLAGHRATTSSTGRAEVCVKLSAGRHHASARKAGYTSATASVRVQRPRPPFTG